MIRLLERIPTEPAPRHVCSFFDVIAGAIEIGAEVFGAGAGAAEGIAAGVGGAAEGVAAGVGGAFEGLTSGLTSGLGGSAAAGATELGTLEGGAAGLSATSALEGAGAGGAAGGLTGGVGGVGGALDAGAASSVLDAGAGFTPAEIGFDASTAAPNFGELSGSFTGFTPNEVGAGLDLPASTAFDAASPATSVLNAGDAVDLTAGGAGTSALDTGGGVNFAGAATDVGNPSAGAGVATDSVTPGATGSAAGSAGSGSGTGGGMFGNIGSTLKTVAPLAALGNLGYNIIKGPPKLPAEAQQLSGLGGSLAATGQQNLTMAANQQITSAQVAEIATWKQQQMNQLYQMYAKNGLDPSKSTDYLQGVQQIEQQAIGMQQQFIDQLIKTGLGETGQATGALQSAAAMQIQNDQDFQKSITAAIQAFGLAAGGGGINLKVA